jgi:hypothetical protein
VGGEEGRGRGEAKGRMRRRRREMGIGKVGEGCMKTEGMRELTEAARQGCFVVRALQ